MSQPSVDSRHAASPARAPVATLALLSMLVGGCATPTPKVPTYVAAAGAPTAKLVMRGNVSSGDAFGVVVYDDAENCKGPRIAGAGSSTKTPATVPLAAGALTTVDFVLIKPNKESCLLRWSFTPVAGKSYLVNGLAYGNSCRAALLDTTNPDAMVTPAGAVRRDAKGNACVPLAQARAAGNAVAQGGQDGGAAVLRPNANADDLQGLISQ